jgi:chemotaxis protein CheC
MTIDIDIEKLSEFNHLTRDGTKSAAENLTELTDVESTVDVSRVNLLAIEDVIGQIDADGSVAVKIDLDQYVEGTIVSVFDHESAVALTEEFMPTIAQLSDGEYGDKHESALSEVCNIVISAYVDSWADVYEETVEILPPDVVDADEFVTRIPGTLAEQEYVLHQNSQVSAVDEASSFDIYLFLEQESLETVIGPERGAGDLSTDTLTLLKDLADDGSDAVAENVGMMTGLDTSVEVTQLDIVPVEYLSEHVPAEESIGVIVKFEEFSSGYLLALFDEASAYDVAAAFDPRLDRDDPPDPATEAFDEAIDDAIGEIGNVIASGFVDAIADEIGEEIAISSPQYLHDLRKSILNDAVLRLAQKQEVILDVNTRIELEKEAFECGIYAMFDLTELVETPVQ